MKAIIFPGITLQAMNRATQIHVLEHSTHSVDNVYQVSLQYSKNCGNNLLCILYFGHRLHKLLVTTVCPLSLCLKRYKMFVAEPRKHYHWWSWSQYYALW